MATKAIQVELLLGGVMDDGDVALSGGKVFTYAAGTLTNKTTWTDRDKTTPATNPIILDGTGRATIFADGIYKFVIKDADNVTIRTIDNLEFGTALTGTVSFSKGADLASASAITIGTDGNYYDITGTTTITSIDAVGIGTVIKLHFEDTLILTHHATDLILPGAKNITTAAGDEAEFIEYANGDWICTNYQKANGNPVINSIVRQLKGVDVASSNALTLGTDGNSFDITGTTAITSIGSLGIGTVVTLHFDASLILTHHATDLILPGGANITTAAGDEAIFVEYATGDWRCINYQKAASIPFDKAEIVGEVAGVRDVVRNLVIKNNTTNPIYQIDIDADEIYLQDSSELPQRVSSVNLTVDITVSGVNGLDTGSEASSTWYYIWKVAKEDGTQAGLLSTSTTAPTMPSGYTYKALVGAAYNDASSNFETIHQFGDRVARPSSGWILSGGTSTSYASVNLTSVIPTTAKYVHLQIFIKDDAASYEPSMWVAANTSGLDERRLGIGLIVSGPGGGYGLYGTVDSLILETAQTIYYKMLAGGTGVSIGVTGWSY